MNDNIPSNIPAFPHGLRVFLRSQMPDGSLHNIDFPQARNFTWEPRVPIISFSDGAGVFLGAVSQEWFSFVLPLIPVGPGSDAKN